MSLDSAREFREKNIAYSHDTYTENPNIGFLDRCGVQGSLLRGYNP